MSACGFADIHLMKGKPTTRMKFLARRRARQRRGDAGRSYTFELAALHLQLLAAMAAVDLEVRSVEVEEVGAFIDRTALPPRDIERLEELVRASLATPPQLEPLVANLSMIAKRPALANMLAADLSRVAAADARADLREIALLELVCATLQVQVPSIQIAEPAPAPRSVSTGLAPTRQPRIVVQHRVRTAVRTALESSYEASDHPFGR